MISWNLNYLVMGFSIWMNFLSQTENLVSTRCSILEIFKKSGLVDEVLGSSSNLAPDR